jgi:hypothetical protein
MASIDRSSRIGTQRDEPLYVLAFMLAAGMALAASPLASSGSDFVPPRSRC